MKKIIQDIFTLFVWIFSVLLLSWSLIWFTSGICTSSLIKACNAELKKQGSTQSVNEESLSNRTALPMPVASSLGMSMNLVFIDKTGHIGNLYPLSSSSKAINSATASEIMDFYVALILSNPVLNKKRNN
ncbi:MAG: hypothetical protein GX438_02340 [Treponema sp.]|nr:hypothetical protein [Treponema sp.]